MRSVASVASAPTTNATSKADRRKRQADLAIRKIVSTASFMRLVGSPAGLSEPSFRNDQDVSRLQLNIFRDLPLVQQVFQPDAYLVRARLVGTNNLGTISRGKLRQAPVSS